ncbi:Crp/Fnr family transcriptional regulator [Paucibacter sp. O1-1]|nr:Crp/Fnr family transcriptional regulator [Paucibacter sp. O1-1]MDA3831136.1 Crp/Fnr family transcriptional regulator [Paucibacter sp. O1-1]
MNHFQHRLADPNEAAVRLVPAHNSREGLCGTLSKAFRPGLLSAAAALELAQLGQFQKIPAKTLFIRADEPASALWLLVNGTVSVGCHDEQQQWRQTRTIHAGHWIDAESAWLGGNYLESARAETAVSAYWLPVREVEQAFVTRPEIARSLLAAVAERVRRVSGDAHDLLAKSVLARCAGWLIDELQTSDQSSAVVMNQHKRAIASQLGTSPETFSRMLRQLCDMKVIDMDRYRIHVRDAQALHRLSNGALAHGAKT